MRADRLISILLLLQIHGRLTAQELAGRLEVSERTIYRDMAALSSSGVPVVAERGTGGGWYLMDGYQTNLTGLNEAEVQALFLSAPDRLLGDLGLTSTAESAMIKLLAALPAAERRDADFLRQRIFVDVAGWRSIGENLSVLPVLQEAIWTQHKLHVVYQRGDDQQVARLIDPLGLVAKGQTWYLVGSVENELRTYRVSRIVDIEKTEKPFMRPAGFDLERFWRESVEEFVARLPSYPAILRVASARLSWVETWRFARIQKIEPPDVEGWHIVYLTFDVIEEACGFVLGCGDEIEVIDPPQLRARIIELAQITLRFYELVSKEQILKE